MDKRLNKQKNFVIVSSVINSILLFLLIYSLFATPISFFLGLFFLVFPLFASGIAFLVSRKVKKHDLMRSLKYVNIVYFCTLVFPVGMVWLFFVLFPAPVAVAMYGVEPRYYNYLFEECLETCYALGNYTSEVIERCLEQCRKLLR